MDYIEAVKAIDARESSAPKALLAIASRQIKTMHTEFCELLSRICAITLHEEADCFNIQSTLEPTFQSTLPRQTALEWLESPGKLLNVIFSAACGIELSEVHAGTLQPPDDAFSELSRSAPNDLALSEYSPAIKNDLDYGNDVLITGPSASGKTIIAFQVAQIMHGNNQPCWYIDINASLEDFWQKLLQIVRLLFVEAEHSAEITLFIDNVQGSTRQFSLATSILDLATALSGKKVLYCFIGWPSVATLPRFQSGDIRKRQINNSEQANFILTRSPHYRETPDLRREVNEVIDGDCFLAHQLILSANAGNPKPNFDALSRSALAAVVGSDEISAKGTELLYVLAALGMVELYVSESWLLSFVRVSKWEIGSFAGLRRLGDNISIGHRSKAFLINRFLQKKDPTLSTRYGTVQEIVEEYSLFHGDAAILQTLDRIEISAQMGKEDDLDTNQIPSQLWLAFTSLRNRIQALSTEDPTWGKNTASVALALTVLKLIDWEAWKRSYQHLENTWSISEGHLERTDDTIERDDFDAIRERMVAQEKELKEDTPTFWERAEEINLDRMHQNWVLGLLLMAESTARRQNKGRTSELTRLALSEIDMVGGVYPRRVPWVAARLLTGLSMIGYSVSTSPEIKRGADWLLTPAPVGPRKGNHWTPGTGDWNDDFQATAMVLGSCLSVGVSPNNDHLRAASDYLDTNRHRWALAGSEITTIDVIVAQIEMGKDWRDYLKEIRMVLDWILDATHWSAKNAAVKATEVGYESSKLAQVSSRALDLIFNILKANLEYVVSQGIRRFEKFADFFDELEEDNSDLISHEFQDAVRARYNLIRNYLENELEQRARMLNASQPTATVKATIKDYKNRIATLRNISRQMENANPDWQSIEREVDEVGSLTFGEYWRDIR